MNNSGGNDDPKAVQWTDDDHQLSFILIQSRFGYQAYDSF